jgi:hypothetical protein
MSRLPHFLDNRLADGGEAVSLTHRPPFTPQEIPGTHFCQRLSRLEGHNADGRIRSIEKIHLIGTRTRDLPACYRVPPCGDENKLKERDRGEGDLGAEASQDLLATVC